jgi:hypothetical protein
VPVAGESPLRNLKRVDSFSGLAHSSPSWISPFAGDDEVPSELMQEESVEFAPKILDKSRRHLQSRDREVFTALDEIRHVGMAFYDKNE